MNSAREVDDGSMQGKRRGTAGEAEGWHWPAVATGAEDGRNAWRAWRRRRGVLATSTGNQRRRREVVCGRGQRTEPPPPPPPLSDEDGAHRVKHAWVRSDGAMEGNGARRQERAQRRHSRACGGDGARGIAVRRMRSRAIAREVLEGGRVSVGGGPLDVEIYRHRYLGTHSRNETESGVPEKITAHALRAEN